MQNNFFCPVVDIIAVFLLSVSEIADPCCAVFLGHKSVPDTALCRSHGA